VNLWIADLICKLQAGHPYIGRSKKTNIFKNGGEERRDGGCSMIAELMQLER
jgi:hypothetical protein